jgi:hypothetical protein
MKKLLISVFTFIICLLADGVNAQINKREKIEAFKIAFITQRLNLSPDESQNFWPIYNQYQKEISDLIMQRRVAKNDLNSDPIEAIDEQLDIDGRIVAVRKKYRKEFTKVLSPDKINQFYTAERDFREELIKQLKNR